MKEESVTTVPEHMGSVKVRRPSLNEPIIVVIGFNLLTLAFMMTAPVAWDAENLPSIYALVLLCQLLILTQNHQAYYFATMHRARTISVSFMSNFPCFCNG